MHKHFKIYSVKFNVLLNMIYTLMNTIFPVITFPYVSRILSASGIGRVNFFSQISSYCIMLASLGIGTYGIRAVARVRNDDYKLAAVVKELLLINIFMTTIVMVFYVIIAIISPQFYTNIPLAIINAVAIITAPFSLDWLYSGLEQYSYITKRDFIFKLIVIISIFGFVKNRSDYVVYAFILMLSNLGTAVINFFNATRLINFSLKQKLKFKCHIKPTLTLFGSTLAISVYFSLDTIMLGYLCGDRQVGLYTTAIKVETILLTVVNAISVALLPRLSAYIEEKKYAEFNKVLKSSISIIMAITSSLAVFFIITAKDCILILGGNDFLGATLSMQLLMPILMISGFSNITGNQILIPKGRDMEYTKAVSIAAMIDILINILVMKKYGSTGAAFATLITEIVQMSIQFYYARKDIIKNINYKSLIKILISVSFAAVVLLIVRNYLIELQLLISMIIQAAVFFSVVLIMLILLKEKEVHAILLDFVKKS